MAKKINPLIPGAIIVGGLGVAYYWWTLKDNTPVGLVVTNQVDGKQPIGENSGGKALTAGAVEGTWREDKNSLSVASESAEKPLLVVYEDGTPIHAELITMSEWAEIGEDNLPDVCKDDINTQECGDALTVIQNALIENWRAFGKDAGATEESLDEMWPVQESAQSQEAETFFGPIMNLQSHFVW
jgi:hypothetical protein